VDSYFALVVVDGIASIEYFTGDRSMREVVVKGSAGEVRC
jgi:hypothetical protein